MKCHHCFNLISLITSKIEEFFSIMFIYMVCFPCFANYIYISFAHF